MLIHIKLFFENYGDLELESRNSMGKGIEKLKSKEPPIITMDPI
jgi:hypothetical protein